MRRFSQRNSLVTLNEINITPLLDLAFVLLVIFIITRPLLEQSIPLNLPKGGSPSGKVDVKDRVTVEINKNGEYVFNGRKISLNDLMANLEGAAKLNSKIWVALRCDESTAYKYPAELIDRCKKRGITQLDLRTFPEK